MMTSLVSEHPTVSGNHEPLCRYRDMVFDGLPVDAADNRDRDKLKPKSSPLIIRLVTGDSGEAK
jgi:hypothetical protein